MVGNDSNGSNDNVSVRFDGRAVGCFARREDYSVGGGWMLHLYSSSSSNEASNEHPLSRSQAVINAI
jgi:hypothetical protein